MASGSSRITCGTTQSCNTKTFCKCSPDRRPRRPILERRLRLPRYRRVRDNAVSGNFEMQTPASLFRLLNEFNMLLLGVFAALALLLAAIGIYSVLSYSVRQLVPEIGIRLALGARLADVLRLVLIEGMKPALLGVAIGIGALPVGVRAATAQTPSASSAELTTPQSPVGSPAGSRHAHHSAATRRARSAAHKKHGRHAKHLAKRHHTARKIA